MTNQKFDRDSTITSLLYLISKAHGKIDYYTLVKLMYFADKKHFHTWAHTITGDIFARMPHGSTGSNTLDLLCAARGDTDYTKADITFAQHFFRFEPNNIVVALTEPDLDNLSDAEIDTLDKVYDQYAHLTFSELKRLAHDKAYNKRPNLHFMTYEDLAEDNKALLDHLGFDN